MYILPFQLILFFIHILSCPVPWYRAMSADSLFLLLYLGCPVLFLDTWLGVQRSCQVLDTVLRLRPPFQLVLFLYYTMGSCPVMCYECSHPVSFSMSKKCISCPISRHYECRQPVYCHIPVEHFGRECRHPVRLVLFLLNISGILSCTWKLSYECRHPVGLSYSCRTFWVSCLVPENWANSADTLSACPFLIEHFWCPVPGNWAMSAVTLSACPFRNATRSLS